MDGGLSERKGKRKVRFSEADPAAAEGEAGARAPKRPRGRRQQPNCGLLVGSDDEDGGAGGGPGGGGTAIGGAGADGEVGARTAATGEDLSTLDPSVAAARRSQARAAAREGVSQETLRRAAELETESRGGDVLAEDDEDGEEEDDEGPLGGAHGGADEDDMGVQLEPFNLKRERELGDFDEDGNYVERRVEKDIVDAWLDGVEVDATAAERAAARDEALRAAQRAPVDAEEVGEASKAEVLALKRKLVAHLREGETATATLARLSGRRNTGGGRGAAATARRKLEPEAAAAVEEVTDAASALLDAGDFGIYGKSREELQKDLDAEDASKAASRSKLLADDDDGDDMFASSDDEGAAPAKREQAAAGGGDDGNASGSGGGATAAPPGFVLDEKSGYYVDASTGVYYHPGHQLYFSSGRWYSWSQDKGYVEAAAPTPQPQPERKPTADEVDAMGVARLKATLTAAGGDPAKHVEKEELRTAVKRAIGLL